MLAQHSQKKVEETISLQLDIDLHGFEVVDWLPSLWSDYLLPFLWLVGR